MRSLVSLYTNRLRLIASHTNPATVLSVCAAEFQCTTAETRRIKNIGPALWQEKETNRMDAERVLHSHRLSLIHI